MKILGKQFRSADLIKIPIPPLQDTLSMLLAHIVRTGGDREKLTIIRQSLFEIDQFLVECLSEGKEIAN